MRTSCATLLNGEADTSCPTAALGLSAMYLSFRSLELLPLAEATTISFAAPLFAIAGDGPLQDELAARITAERLPVVLLGRRGDVADLLGAAGPVGLTRLAGTEPSPELLPLMRAIRAAAERPGAEGDG